MTTAQEKELDILYQTTLLEKCNHKSILGGEATLIHHFLQGRYKSIRWYTPCGIPVTQEQHNTIHSKNGERIEKLITNIKGAEWLKDLERRKFTPAINLDFNKVKAHILGEVKDYL